MNFKITSLRGLGNWGSYLHTPISPCLRIISEAIKSPAHQGFLVLSALAPEKAPRRETEIEVSNYQNAQDRCQELSTTQRRDRMSNNAAICGDVKERILKGY